MVGGSYDVITVGGGLGGAAFAKRMAEHGARILVLERERQFKDRVRGEYLAPWGVAEARMLGLYDVLRDTCGHALLWIETYVDSRPPRRRHLPSSTPHPVPAMGLYHPAMQEVALQAAEAAGAEVQRGASVRSVRPGQVPSVVIDHNGHHTELRARLVVGADGRASMVRQWASLPVQHDPERLYIAGVLLEELLRHDDWEAAGQAYAREHNRYFGVVHTAEEWLTAMFHETGPVADARRDKALPLIAQDPTRRPDVTASGPDCLLDETARRRFFGED